MLFAFCNKIIVNIRNLEIYFLGWISSSNIVCLVVIISSILHDTLVKSSNVIRYNDFGSLSIENESFPLYQHSNLCVILLVKNSWTKKKRNPISDSQANYCVFVHATAVLFSDFTPTPFPASHTLIRRRKWWWCVNRRSPLMLISYINC